jgi:RHS repeat-associated protein
LPAAPLGHTPVSPLPGERFRTYYNAGARPVAGSEAARTWANVPGVTAHEVQYLHPDHLGSIGQITSQTGAWVQDVYFHPYGGIRWSQSGGNAISPTSSTRRTYTGQYDIGFWAGAIQHYNARQYDYVLGRFLQPDTIVPNPGNPYDLNRYMYSLSNPINYTDPSGHEANRVCDAACESTLDRGWRPSLKFYGIELTGSWSSAEVNAVYAAVETIGVAFVQTLGNGYIAATAFRAVFRTAGDPITFTKSGCANCGAFAITNNSRQVTFHGVNGVAYGDPLRARNHVIHELGHVFNASFSNAIPGNSTPYQTLDAAFVTSPGLRRSASPGGYQGFASDNSDSTWQLHGKDLAYPGSASGAGEVFADQFLGWSANSWQTEHGALTVDGSLRANWMNEHMPGWVINMAGYGDGE